MAFPRPHFRIQKLTAYIAVDPSDDSEGIIGINGMPAIGADEDRIKSLRPQAVMVGKAAGVTVKLVQFTTREEVETVVE